MIKKILIFTSIVVLGLLSLQSQNVTNLCYDEEFTERISVNPDAKLNNLTILEKLKFIEKKYTQKHHVYFNRAGNATRDVYFLSHENMFPEWYTPPTIFKSDETGTKSYFTTHNQYQVDGWTGGLKTTTKLGEYKVNAKGEKYLEQRYSSLADQYYQTWNQKAQTDGFLPMNKYRYPTSRELDDMEREGFVVDVSGDLIKVSDSSIRLVWDTKQKVFNKQEIEAGSVVSTTRSYYKLDKVFNELLIHRKVVNTPGIFTHGDCYEMVTETIYENYDKVCMTKDLTLSSDELAAETENDSRNQLKVFPNPANDQLTVQIPIFEMKTTLQITNLDGEVLKLILVDKNAENHTFNVNNLPAGIYVIKCIQGNSNFSSKFVKL